MNWLAFFLMLPHLKPKCLDILNPTLYRSLDLLRILSLLIICALFTRAFAKTRKLPSPPSILLGVMEVWIFFVTFRSDGDYVEIGSIAVSLMAIILLVDLYAGRMKELITALMLNYEWLVYVNLWSLWKYPGAGLARDLDYGYMAIYFFGPDNWFMYLCIPAVCVALLYMRVRLQGKIAAFHIFRGLLMIAAAYYTIYLSWPVTALVALTVLAIVLLMSVIPGVRCCVTASVVFVGGIAANLAIVVFRVMDTVPFIAEFMQNTLKKDTTLTGRTPIWIDFTERVHEHLWIGIGNPAAGYAFGNGPFDHLHNQYFDLMALGGLPALILYLGALLLTGWMLIRHSKTLAARIMTAGMAALLMICIPESCRHGSIFLLFPLAYHVGKTEAAVLLPRQEAER